MKLLIDENLPPALRPLLIGHDAFTVAHLGWRGVRNGELLRRAAAEGFDALVTRDRSLPDQQNLSALPCGLVILTVSSMRVKDLTRIVPQLLNAIARMSPCSVVRVVAP